MHKSTVGDASRAFGTTISYGTAGFEVRRFGACPSFLDSIRARVSLLFLGCSLSVCRSVLL